MVNKTYFVDVSIELEVDNSDDSSGFRGKKGLNHQLSQ